MVLGAQPVGFLKKRFSRFFFPFLGEKTRKQKSSLDVELSPLYYPALMRCLGSMWSFEGGVCEKPKGFLGGTAD